MKFINQLKENDIVEEVYIVNNKNKSLSKTGKYYYAMSLIDKTGNIDGRVWQIDNGSIEDFNNNDFVFVKGEVRSFNGKLQISIDKIRVAKKDEYDINNYYNTSKITLDVMEKELIQFIDKVKNKNFNKLLKSIFIDDKEFYKRFIYHQGGKFIHHNFIHGLLEHTLSVVKDCDLIYHNYPYLNYDLIITTALLHDIGKVYEINPIPINEYTDDGYMLGHITMGFNIIKNKIDEIGSFSHDEELELLHCILSHHGTLEFGSPKEPMLPEAFIVSTIDNLDAKMSYMNQILESYKASNKFDKYGFVGRNNYMQMNFRESKINKND